ncbi:cytochrome c-type biogenesis protein CcmH [Nocardioides sp. DS6]|uniref:Cytochrome c-type biogenesis protein n=1 Tax=Nocardioides eburneus TaxID=3231482 RepID=A0ABV3T600_9ACTN
MDVTVPTGRGRRRLRLLPYAVGLVALVVLVLTLLPGMPGLPGTGSPSLDDRTQDVAARLRCPTCVGESAADSTSPVAESMRSEARRQLAQGRSEDQVVAWFRTRYGADIVLDPQRRGLGWVLWAAPPVAALAVVGGIAGLVVVRRRRLAVRDEAPDRADAGADTGADDEPGGGADGPALALPAGRLAVVVTVAVGAAVAVPLLVLGGRGDDAAASGSAAPNDATSEATSSPSSSPSSSTASNTATDPVARAFALLRAGRPAAAERLVRPVSRRPGADRPLALLVLGLAQRAEGDPAATATLRAFVERYPHHAAAAQVRRLLAAS